jgi:hypothetical protein
MAGESVFISYKIFHHNTCVDRPMGKINKLVSARNNEDVIGLLTA